jgi:energy-coupling factor transporter ATP-binding protein EcfA2
MLSKGMRQCVAAASVFATEPSLLLLDEPTVWLDEERTEIFTKAAEKRLKDGAAILMITHDLALARRIATRTVTLKEGRLAA